MDRLPDQERRRHKSYARTADAGMVNGREEVTTEARGKYGKNGAAIANFTEYLHTWTSATLTSSPGLPSTSVQGPSMKRVSKPVSAGSVGTRIGGVATQIGLDRGTIPLQQPYSNKLILPIHHMLKGFGNFD